MQISIFVFKCSNFGFPLRIFMFQIPQLTFMVIRPVIFKQGIGHPTLLHFYLECISCRIVVWEIYTTESGRVMTAIVQDNADEI